jgi:hypothetical protein
MVRRRTGPAWWREARRDTLRRLMPDVRRQEGEEPSGKASPCDPFQLTSNEHTEQRDE